MGAPSAAFLGLVAAVAAKALKVLMFIGWSALSDILRMITGIGIASVSDSINRPCNPGPSETLPS